mmetsp:Transcript_18269/g.28994  ORF Transcript_18269/g.28994 Transcript_18269/m.28994 type:complete len:251 (+) Transcript_18269:273-1025(+)
MGALHVIANALGPLHQAALAVQSRVFARLRIQRVQLTHRVAQEVFFGADRVHFSFGGSERFAGGSHVAPRHTGFGPGRSEGCEFVKDIAVPARVQQAPVIMLTMQFNQRVGERAQHFARAATVIDPGRLATVSRVHAAQDQFVSARQASLVQHGVCRVIRGQIKPRRNLPLRGPLTDQIGAAPPAQHKAQTVQKNGFARPGFPGQHIQTRLKREFQPVDDQHVGDIKPAQHQSFPVRRSSARHGPRATGP